MKDIDYYIELSKTMKNTSDGGSPSYCFDDVVLVKYTNYVNYGEARKGAEEVAVAANNKNREGVRTPKHLAIKRETVGNETICWVLQERAKGECFTNYSLPNAAAEECLNALRKLVAMPTSHIEKYVSDLMSLFNMGLEMKPKNFFYDDDILNGGFTFIDLLAADETPVDVNSISEIRYLVMLLMAMTNNIGVFSFTKNATKEQVTESSVLRYKLNSRVLKAMESIIPTFDQHKRWIFRSFEKEAVEFYKKDGIDIGDLTLTNEEEYLFNKGICEVVECALQKLINGEIVYWQVHANEIRLGLESRYLNIAWRYHNGNKVSEADYERYYDYTSSCDFEINNMVMEMFNSKLEELAKDTDNLNVLKAIQELNKRRENKKSFL